MYKRIPNIKIRNIASNIFTSYFEGKTKAYILSSELIKQSRHFKQGSHIDIKPLIKTYKLNCSNCINIHVYDSLYGDGSAYNMILSELKSKYEFKGYLSFDHGETLDKIRNICQKINPINWKHLESEFLLYTKHINNDSLLDITQLVKRFPVFEYIIKDSRCISENNKYYVMIDNDGNKYRDIILALYLHCLN